MLQFISTMVTHVEGTEAYEDKKPALMQLFKPLHETEAWSENARIIFDMGHLLFDREVGRVKGL